MYPPENSQKGRFNIWKTPQEDFLPFYKYIRGILQLSKGLLKVLCLNYYKVIPIFKSLNFLIWE